MKHSASALALLAAALLAACPGPLWAEAQGGTAAGAVYRVPVEGFIGDGLAYFVGRSVKAAKKAGAGLIVFEITTNGGAVDAALDICTHIGEAAPVKTVAFIKNRAWSAGAIIAVSCERIYMRDDSTIGSAQPVTLDPKGGGSAALGEKHVSAVRAQFRTLAERNGYNPDLAAAMVDKDIALTLIKVDGKEQIVRTDKLDYLKTQAEKAKQELEVVETLIDKGKLLNLSAKQALDYGFVSGVVRNLDEVLSAYGLAGQPTQLMGKDWAEVLVSFVSHPAVSGLLMALGGLGIWMELKTPGFGLPGALGLAAFVLLFGSHHLLGHANLSEMLLFLTGLVLLGVEVFVIPGFGIVGIAGILCLGVSLVLAMQGFTLPSPDQPWQMDRSVESALTVMVSMSLFLVVSLAVLAYLPLTSRFNPLVLKSTEAKDAGYVSVRPEEKALVGKRGVSISTLRPSGRADIDGLTIDVVTEGDFVDPGQQLEVVRCEGNRIVVRPV